MPGHDTMHADGGWTVELVNPVEGFDTVRFSPLSFDQSINWAQKKYPSTLALMSEMAQLPEQKLRLIKYPDVDRLMFAFTAVLPPGIRADVEKGIVPFTTPEGMLPDPVLPPEPVGDPRFPIVPGNVKPFPVDETGSGFSLKPPEAVKSGIG